MLSGDHFFVARERGLLKKFNLYQPSRLELYLSKAFVLSQPTNNTREYPDHFFFTDNSILPRGKMFIMLLSFKQVMAEYFKHSISDDSFLGILDTSCKPWTFRTLKRT